jgi:hypothetical protein
MQIQSERGTCNNTVSLGGIIILKGQCHEIFDPRFFRQSITPRPLINTLKYFRIRRAIRPLSLIPGYAA